MKKLSRSRVSGLASQYRTYTYADADTAYTATVNPIAYGFNLNIQFESPGSNVDIELSGAYAPTVGDQIRIMVGGPAPVDTCYVRAVFAEDTVLIASNSPAVFEYVSTGGSLRWAQVSEPPGSLARPNPDISGRALGTWETFTRALEAFDFTGFSDFRQTMAHGTADGEFYCAAYMHRHSGSPGPGSVWMGRPDEPRLRLQTGGFPEVPQAVLSSGLGTYMIVGGTDAMSPSTLTGHVSVGTYGIDEVNTWTMCTLPTYPGTKLSCPPAEYGNTVVFAIQGDTNDILCLTYDFGTTWYQQVLGSPGTTKSVHINSSHVYYTSGNGVYRAVVGSTSFSLVYTAANPIRHIGPAIGGSGVVVTTAGGIVVYSRTGDPAWWEGDLWVNHWKQSVSSANANFTCCCNGGKNYLVVSAWDAATRTRQLHYSSNFACRDPKPVGRLPMSNLTSVVGYPLDVRISGMTGLGNMWFVIPAPAPYYFPSMAQADLTAAFTLILERT